MQRACAKAFPYRAQRAAYFSSHRNHRQQTFPYQGLARARLCCRATRASEPDAFFMHSKRVGVTELSDLHIAENKF
jgi:hypothetical protein